MEHDHFFLTHINYIFRIPIINILQSANVLCKDMEITGENHKHIDDIFSSATELLNSIDRISKAIFSEIIAINSEKKFMLLDDIQQK